MIQPFSLGQEEKISALIQSVFNEFVGFEYTDEGNKIFSDFIAPNNIIERHKKGNILLTWQQENTIIGMIEIRDNNHVCLFFVDKNYHGKGIGKKLFREVVSKIEGKTNFIEVNASPYSEKIYEKLGFKKTGEKTEINGILFVPMKMVLNQSKLYDYEKAVSEIPLERLQ